MRNEFGYKRTTCACVVCTTNCRFMPGFLIPSDLDRLLPSNGQDLAQWAEANLLASPGALVMDAATGNQFRIHTLVPATKPNGSCVHLSEQGLCGIHENAPFGCAFFDCGPERGHLSRNGLIEVMKEWQKPLMESIYVFIWIHLWDTGRRQHAPDVLRKRMQEYIDGKALGTFNPAGGVH